VVLLTLCFRCVRGDFDTFFGIKIRVVVERLTVEGVVVVILRSMSLIEGRSAPTNSLSSWYWVSSVSST
jgi:hypothetical protein